MSNMFRSSQATSLDLSNFNTSNLTNMSYMFMVCCRSPLCSYSSYADKFDSTSAYSGVQFTLKP